MKLRCIISGIYICLFALFTFPLYSQVLSVDYLEGKVEKKEGSKWIELFKDDTLEIQSTIRLQKGSMIELSGNNINITIIKPGTYNCKKIVEESRKTDSFGIDDILASKFAALTEDAENNDSDAVMGVRAADIEKETDFIGDEIIEEIFRVAKKKIAKEDYKGALSLLEEAYDLGDETNESIFLYYIGYCYNQLGYEARAITYLMDVSIGPEMPFYPEYVMLFGSLLMRSFALQDALALFLDYIKASGQSDLPENQDIHYLTALCYIQMDDLEKAYTFLDKAKTIDPGTETGKKAESLLKDLR